MCQPNLREAPRLDRGVVHGASGRIGTRIANELLDRGHDVTGVSRRGTIEDIDHSGFEAVAGDATDADEVARLAADHDAVASALGPDEDNLDALTEMATGLVEGLKQSGVGRLVWTGGAGGLHVGPETQLIETDEFPDELVPLALVHIDTYEIISDVDDLDWTVVAPPAVIEPGERTGEYRTAEGQLVADADGESHISMEDFAIAFVDELETDDAVHTQLGVGY